MRPSTTLPLTWTFLHILLHLNWIIGVAIFSFLVATMVAPGWLFPAIGITPTSDLMPLMNGMRVIAILGIVSVPINHAILSRLIPIIETVRRRDPFVAANAYRLNMIAWALLALQLISLVVGGIGAAVETPEHRLRLDAGFSIPGWLCVLFAFILARVFAEGTLMREELDGTI